MFSFDANKVEDFQGGVLPAGSYPTVITKAEFKPANSNPNHHVVSLELALTQAGHPFDGWRIYDTYNVVNSNEMAQKIGLSDLKKLCTAIGISAFTDPQELVGHSFLAETKTREYNGKTYSNVVGRTVIQHSYPTPRQAPPIVQQAVPQAQTQAAHPHYVENADIPF